MVECLNTLHQLRRQRVQLFRAQVAEIGQSHGADFASAGSTWR
jgi:hypothetical protein